MLNNNNERGSGIRRRPAGSNAQNFQELRDKCLRQKILFIDPEFETNNLTLHFKNLPKRRFEWRRLNEIAKNPKLFVAGASRFDVKQGSISDCWLLASVASLTLNKELLHRVVPNDQGFGDKYAGIFHFRFWQFGKWVDVVVDDRLPTSEGKLIFLHSAVKNEFWSALLEKAYAKINGSYEALESGFTMDAMADLTGGVPEMYELNKVPPNLFMIMLHSFERQSLMCGTIFKSQFPDPTDKGLVKGHAYSITKISYILEPNDIIILLIRLRNPYGNDHEWNGRWSDTSNDWLSLPKKLKKKLGITKENDGKFWMLYDDFVKYFSALDICHLAPGSIAMEHTTFVGKKWDLNIFEGEWFRGATTGGFDQFQESFSSNLQYLITLEDPEDNDSKNKYMVIIALMVKETSFQRKQRDKSVSIGFYVFKLNTSESVSKPLDTIFFENNDPLDKFYSSGSRPRGICKRLNLPPGSFCIVPCTSNHNKK